MRSDRTDEERSRQSGGGDREGAPAPDESGAAPGSSAPEGSEEGPPSGDSGVESEATDREESGGNAEFDDLRERYLRLAAEFDNYRKRTDRERTEHSVRAQGRLVQSLLDAVDDLERVADYTPDTTTVAALLEGVQMVERKLLRALESAGLERLDAKGEPFDPTHHEALMTAPTEAADEDDTVGEVFQKGYRFQGHLIRPARVQVRKHMG